MKIVTKNFYFNGQKRTNLKIEFTPSGIKIEDKVRNRMRKKQKEE